MRIAVALLALTLAASAAAKFPNITGNWKANLEKGDWGPGTSPAEMSWRVEDSDEKLVLYETMVMDAGQPRRTTLTFLKKGESVNKGEGGEIRTTLKEVEGAIHELSTMKTSDGGTIRRTSVTTVSDDGKTMTQVSTVTLPDGQELKRRLVLEKQ